MRLQSQRGFSLIEILVVLLIASITVGFAVLAFGDFGQGRQAQETAKQLRRSVMFLREQAMLRIENYVLLIDKTGSHVQASDSMEITQAASTRFPAGTVVHFEPEADQVSVEIHSSGTITPFSMSIGTLKKPNLMQVRGTLNGTVTVSETKRANS